MSITREAVLETASSLINGDRADQYGNAHDTHQRIANMWNTLVFRDPGSRIEAHDVALMMICVKLVRAAKNPGYADSYIDIAGYAALAAEMAGAE